MKKQLNPVVAIIVVLAALGIIGSVAFYQEEVMGFIRLQGWNTRPVAEGTRQFVDAAARDDGNALAPLLASDSATLEPIREGDEVVAFMVGAYGGPKRQSLKELCPSADPEISSPKLSYLDGGGVEINVSYPGKHMLQLRWDRKPDGWKLTDLDLAD